MPYYENKEYGSGYMPLFGPNLNNKQHGNYDVFYSMHLKNDKNTDVNTAAHYIGVNQKDTPGTIATFRWDPQHGMIKHVGVAEAHERRGIATAMYHLAQRLSSQYGVPAPQHSMDRTDEGDAWARKVGGELPERSDWHLWDQWS